MHMFSTNPAQSNRIKKLIVFFVTFTGFVAAIITILAYIFSDDLAPSPGRPVLEADLRSPDDGYKLFQSFEKYLGQTVVLTLTFRTRAAGGVSSFHFGPGSDLNCSSDDPHKLCFGSGESNEIEIELPPYEFLAGRGSTLLIRFPSWGSYIYGYENTMHDVSFKGIFTIQSFGHVGQGYWAADLRPSG